MNGMMPTPSAILLALEPISHIFLILGRSIVLALTFRALKSNDLLHTVSSPRVIQIRHPIQPPQ